MSDKTICATNDNGRIRMIVGTKCSRIECERMGCCFPNCAEYSNEEFESESEAKEKYPDLEIV